METGHKKKKLVFVSFVLSLILAFVVFAVSSYYGGRTESITHFNCFGSQTNETFTINVDVDVLDGLDRDEALEVATSLWTQVCPRARDQIRSFSSNASFGEDSVWIVKLAWARVGTAPYPGTNVPTTRLLHESLQVLIDTSNRTLTYSALYYNC